MYVSLSIIIAVVVSKGDILNVGFRGHGLQILYIHLISDPMNTEEVVSNVSGVSSLLVGVDWVAGVGIGGDAHIKWLVSRIEYSVVRPVPTISIIEMFIVMFENKVFSMIWSFE